ncbi:hypothetical protein [Mycoplasma sp. E35C]|uniref:hypothetical protein n=1 Tax=Mycoplasma sp. E35C TaxID=2801918 RepID=UPI001CA41389|nr:hypothetical protein [Mycoplasma sp. E35C]QZX49128.1 hypothetical protein JJE79_03695 [Mycoplasma sp. E35C]
MKKSRILKLASLFSVLGVSSLVVASCAKASDRSNAPYRQIQGGENDQKDNSKPATDVEKLEQLIKSLSPESFKLIDTSNNNANVEFSSIEADTVKAETKYSFQLKDVSEIPQGWTPVIQIKDSDNKKGVVQVQIQFTKGNEKTSDRLVEINGFKSLSTAIMTALFSDAAIPTEYKGVNKKALNIGDIKFVKLSEINKQKELAATPAESVESTDSQSSSTDTSSQQSPETKPEGETQTQGENQTQAENQTQGNDETEGATLREEAQPAIMTNGFQETFAQTFGEQGINKDAVTKIKEYKSDFKAEDLYLTGAAAVDSLWQNQDDKSVSFYLTSKDEQNPLKIKSKTAPEVDVVIPGIVVKNIMPDDVKISVSKIDLPDVNYNPENASNLEAYKTVIASQQEGDADKYKLENDQLFATVSGKDYKINPIQIPYIPQKSNHKVLFKARYIFDGKVVNNDFWTTKIAFKKIVGNGSLTSDAVSIKELADETNNKISYFNNLKENIPSGENITDRFFWMGVGNNGVTDPETQSPDIDITGDANSDSGEGVAQLVNWKETSEKKNEEELLDSNKNDATNYILYTRIKYNTDKDNYGYSWSNQVTLLHINAPIKK